MAPNRNSALYWRCSNHPVDNAAFVLFWLFFFLNSALPQSQLLGAKASNILRTEGNTIEAASDRFMAQAATTPTTKENVLEWVKNDKRRLLHVVYRVGDLDKTIK